ncbi:Vesicle-associated membrane protein-associated protein A [Hondaea fermentalgiana]|uniref:Vesicle-associated membrane protein-associated protein A n=1 Tax=Hondaea fermentalgiana TaxID=2315210 RepID=A0A2R5G878_9STRA|nr:Vesicle-associated membrane protein-associated protein A [Hondaea fermentalgiana]|eukprot:GBG27266.1 Vesicle-associated membrane protein-associated protein A [Hondaea fermentalgiana]
MSMKMQLVKLDPSSVDFPMGEKEPSVTLKVENTSDKMVAFKIKTTHPKRYLVRPNQGVIPVKSASSVLISLQIKDAKQLRQERLTGYETLDKDCKDNKFLVQCAVVKDNYLSKLESHHEEHDSKNLGNLLKQMWAEMTRDELVHKKLTCTFKYPENNEELMEVNNLHSVDVPAGVDMNAGKPRAADDGQLESLPELRKKYQELINFTVQLTAERDRFKASLKDATKEIALLKKGESHRNIKSSSDVSGAGGVSSTMSDSLPGGLASQTGFALWQLMFVAVLAFLLGRLFTSDGQSDMA